MVIKMTYIKIRIHQAAKFLFNPGMDVISPAVLSRVA